MNDLITRVRQKAAALKEACDKNQAAATAHHQAWQSWNAEIWQHTQAANEALVDTEHAWDHSKEVVISMARNLLDMVHLLLSHSPAGTYPELARQAAFMQMGFDQEHQAFNDYNKLIGEAETTAREVWETVSGDCISRAWHLMFEASKLPFVTESQIDTDLDGSTPIWSQLSTREEQDELIYRNRAQTLGKKRAGQLTYAIPRAQAKRRGTSNS